MKANVALAALAAMTLASAGASAELLTNGDFETAAPQNAESFAIGTNLNKWISPWYSWANGGPTGGAKFAQAPTGAGGGDFRLVQFIDASGIAAGSTLTLEFDYIYGFDALTNTSVPRYAYLIGIAADRDYRMYLGDGVDGICSTSQGASPPCPANQPDNAVLSPDALLGSFSLANTSTSWLTDQTLTATLGASYAYIGVVFQASCYDSVVSNCSSYTRGFDNVSLTVDGQVPEPGTLALLGLGLAGLAAARRRNQ